MLKVLIADRRFLIREGLRQVLRNVGEVSAFVEATEADHVFQLLEANEDIDLVLLGDSLSACTKTAKFKRLRQVCRNVPVVMIRDKDGNESDPTLVNLAISQSSTSKAAFIKRLQDVLGYGSSSGDTRISDRQQQILQLLARGLRNKQIAEELGIAETTVREHVSRLLRAFNVNNRSAAVAAAREEGLLTP